MNYSLTCPNCGTKLSLFAGQIKARKGTVRCTRCGNHVKYDLDRPASGARAFWPQTEVPFKPGAQKRFLSIANAKKQNPSFTGFSAPLPKETNAPRIPPAFDRSQNQFQKFDLKTGKILPDTDK